MQAQKAVAKQKAKEEAEETLDRTPANRLRLLRTVVDLLQENETPMMVCILGVWVGNTHKWRC